MDEIKARLQQLKLSVETLAKDLKIEDKKEQAKGLSAQTVRPDFWQNESQAKATMQTLADLQTEIQGITGLRQAVDDQLGLIALALNETGNEALLNDLGKTTEDLERQYQHISTQMFLKGKYDSANALLSIHAGQGGTEACDWADMLARMYARFFEKKGWKGDKIYESKGEEAGIKEATYLVKGKQAYGYLKGEQGTHRLVRQSPFNADNLRQTSFALVEVMPEIDEAQDIEIREEDLEWQFTRAGGHGGQNVNKVNTAVRLKHLPTQLAVECRSERYQEQNRKIALSLLTAKLWQKREQARQKEMAKLKGGTMASWGSQIRNYVLHPYHLVKDVRTGVETPETEATLDGDLDRFIEAELRLPA